MLARFPDPLQKVGWGIWLWQFASIWSDQDRQYRRDSRDRTNSTEYSGRTDRTDRGKKHDWHLKLTFPDTCVGQLSQFLRCCILYLICIKYISYMLYLTTRSTCSPFRLISSKQRKDVLRCQSTELSFRIVGVWKYQAFNLGLQIQDQPRTKKNTPHPECQDIDDSIQGKVEIKRTNYTHATTHTLSVPPTKRSRHLAWLDHLCPSPPQVVLVSFALRKSSKIVCFIVCKYS